VTLYSLLLYSLQVVQDLLSFLDRPLLSSRTCEDDGVFVARQLDSLPTFDKLPEVEGLPKGCTWGLWDKSGQKDELGTLNLLTPSVVKEAYKELSEGISVALKWVIQMFHIFNEINSANR